jgi:sugar/nucleoside kinase (ribokinase family)
VSEALLPPRSAPAALDLLGVGQCSIDHVCRVAELPRLASKQAMLGYAAMPGGQIATAVLAAARLGLRCAFVGAVGSDAAAPLVLAPLEAAGVDCSGVRRVEGVPTRLAVILVDRESGERSVLGYRDPRLALRPEDVAPERVAPARCLLVDGEDPEVAAHAARCARAAGVAVVADVDLVSPGVEALLGHVDFPVVSRSFAEAWSPDGSVRGGLARLVAGGARLAVATLGEHGCLGRLGAREIASPPFAVAPRDTTGAGDVFHAAFAWGLLAGLPVEALLRRANAAAAFACLAPGAQGGLPTRAELESFLATNTPAPWREPEEPPRGAAHSSSKTSSSSTSPGGKRSSSISSGSARTPRSNSSS